MATYANSSTNQALSNLCIGRTLNNDAFLADKIFEPHKTDRDFGKYYKWDEGRNFDRTTGLLRLAGAEAVEVKGDYTTANFSSKYLGVKNVIDDIFIRNADDVIRNNHRKEMALSLTKLLLKVREQDVADMMSNPSNFTGKTTTLSVTTTWSNKDDSDPYNDVLFGLRSIALNAETSTDIFWYMGWDVFDALTTHPKLLDRLRKIDRDAVLDSERLKMLFNLGAHVQIKEILVGSTVRNIAKQGAAKNMVFQHNDTSVLFYKNPRPGAIYEETFAKMFMPSSISAMQVENYRKPEIKGETVEVNTQYSLEIVSSDCAYQYLNAA